MVSREEAIRIKQAFDFYFRRRLDIFRPRVRGYSKIGPFYLELYAGENLSLMGEPERVFGVEVLEADESGHLIHRHDLSLEFGTEEESNEFIASLGNYLHKKEKDNDN